MSLSLKMEEEEEKEEEKEKEGAVVEEEKVAVAAVMAVSIWSLQELVKMQRQTCALEKRLSLEKRMSALTGQVKMISPTHVLEKGLTHVNVRREAPCGHGWLGLFLSLSLARARSLTS